MEGELEKFFTYDLNIALFNLQQGSKAKWGTMTSNEMICHLIQSSEMMHFGNINLLIKEENIKNAIAFLHSKKEIKKGLIVPNNIGYTFNKNHKKDITILKEELKICTLKMFTFLNENNNFISIHPFFGELTAYDWKIFQRKHYKHHLKQFDLI